MLIKRKYGRDGERQALGLGNHPQGIPADPATHSHHANLTTLSPSKLPQANLTAVLFSK